MSWNELRRLFFKFPFLLHSVSAIFSGLGLTTFGTYFFLSDQVVVLGGGSFGTAMAAHVASNKADMEVSMLLRDVDVCRSINETHFNW